MQTILYISYMVFVILRSSQLLDIRHKIFVGNVNVFYLNKDKGQGENGVTWAFICWSYMLAVGEFQDYPHALLINICAIMDTHLFIIDLK